jgi:hypothetical protein
MENLNVAAVETTTQESNMETTIAAVQNNQSQEDVMETTNVAVVNEPQYVTDLKAAFALAIASPKFLENKTKVDAAIKALTVPNAEARVIAQLTAHAEKKLYADAGLAAVKNGGVFVAPTQVEIDAHVAVGLAAWQKKQK